jgi:hypothetical protein
MTKEAKLNFLAISNHLTLTLTLTFLKWYFCTVVRSQNQSKVAVKSKVAAMTSNLAFALPLPLQN